jgi:hypothetical protein
MRDDYQVRRNLVERNEHERTLRQAWMGDLKPVVVDDLIAEQQQIEIERSRPVLNAGGAVASELPLNAEQIVE